jgi:hypothetical protein
MAEPHEHRNVDIKQGGKWDAWVVVYAEGRLELHTENDRYAVLRHGVQPSDKWIDLDYVKNHFSHRVDQVKAALAELGIAKRSI